MSTTTRARLHHAINAWAATRSGAHTLALNATVDSVCIEFELLRREVASQAESMGAAGETIAQLQAQVRDAAAPAVLQALEDLTIAYRTLAGLDGAWDQPLIRAERVVIAAKTAPAQSEPHPPDRQCGCAACLPSFEPAQGEPVAMNSGDPECARILNANLWGLYVEDAPAVPKAAPLGTWAGPSSTACDDQLRAEGGAA